jgi:CHAD domain-containing protein
MSFTLDPTEPIPNTIQAVAEAELDKITEALSGQAGLDPDQATHDARKRTKKLRALLRLVRPALTKDVYRRENGALRDAARQLSAVRDAWVLVEALDGLVTPVTDDLTEHAVAPLRAGLVREYRALQTRRDEHDALGLAAAEFEQVRARVSRWTVADHGWSSLGEGLETVVRRGRHCMARAGSRGHTDDFHEWRKQVKYLRHQLELLRAAWPGVLEAMAGTAAETGDMLGTDHDLAVLRARVLSEGTLAPATGRALLARLDERRRECQQAAFVLGHKLYAEKPSALTHRLGRLWRSAA